MTSSEITTIIFDLGGVYFTDGARRFVTVMEEAYGLSKDEVLAVTSGELGTQYRTSEITPDKFWSEAKKIWKIDDDVATLAERWLREYVPIEGTVKLIERLTSEGYELLFLSDNAADRIEYLDQRYGFLRRFKAGVFSHIVKTRKPDTRMYTTALALTKNPPSSCVYIDDKPKLLEPAFALGMQVIPFTNPEEVAEALRKLGVRC